MDSHSKPTSASPEDFTNTTDTELKVIFPKDDLLEPCTDFLPPDSKHGIQCVIAMFLIHIATASMGYSYGILIIPLTQEFNVGRADVTWIGAGFSATMCLSAGLFGWLGDTYGFRRVAMASSCVLFLGMILSSFSTHLWQIAFCFSLLVGPATAGAFIPSTGCTGQWFVKYRAIAIGIGLSGIGIGSFLFANVGAWLIILLGWRRALQILAVFCFIFSMTGSIMLRRRLPPNKNSINFDFLKKLGPFWTMYCTNFIFQFALIIPFAHLTPYSEDLGNSTAYAAWLVSLLGISSLIGRVVIGLVADFTKTYVRLYQGLMFTLSVIVLVLWYWLGQSWAAQNVFAFCYGFCTGSNSSLTPVILCNFYGPERMATVNGVIFSSFVVGNLLGPVIAGYIFDLNGNYQSAILMCSAVWFCAFIVSMFLPSKNTLVL